MPTVVQFRRGTTTQNNNFLGASGEISVDTTLHVLRVADGETEGGFALVGETASQTITNKVYQGTSLSVTGNVSGNYFIGNGSQLTGIDATSIQNGTSNVRVISSGGAVTTSVGGTSNVVVVGSTGVTITGNLTVTGNATLSGNILGDRIQNGTTSFDIQVQNGNANISVGASSNVAVFSTFGADIAGYVSASGNIIGNYILGNGSQLTGIDATSIQNGTSSMAVIASGGNIRANVGGATIISITSAGIQNGQANGVGNIGNSSSYFNTVFAKATSAQYADLAEMYSADDNYEPGTVVEFGGTNEITISSESHSTRVAGIISTNPSYLMNSALDCTNALEVALVGRVPCRVVGTIGKGDRLVASHLPGVATRLDTSLYQPGCIIGKALESYESADAGVIEVAVGRN